MLVEGKCVYSLETGHEIKMKTKSFVPLIGKGKTQLLLLNLKFQEVELES